MLVALVLFVLGGDPSLHSMTEAELAAYVSDLAERQPDFQARVADVLRRGLGTPYQDGPLGEGPLGVHDKDPLVDFKRADCVTYVEQTIALASGTSYSHAMQNLLRIRYKDADPTYESRNHFMISDWIANNPYCVDVTQKLDVPAESVTRRISRKEFFVRVNADGVGEDTPDQDITLHYIPTAGTAQAVKSLPDATLLVFIGKVDWLFSLHCGVYLRDGSGEGKMYHASSKADEVVGVDLAEYMQSQSGRYIGFTAYEITEPSFSGN